MNQDYNQFVSYEDNDITRRPDYFEDFDFSFVEKEKEAPTFLFDTFDHNSFESPSNYQQTETSSNHNGNNVNMNERFIVSNSFYGAF
jgi:hypothetical protein